MLKHKVLIIGLLCVSVTVCGCSNMNNTEKDAALGAGAGAGMFALLTRGNPVAAVFGGLVGGLIGGSIGNSEDHREARDKAVQAAVVAQARNQMSYEDIVQLSYKNTPPRMIIDQIYSSGSVFSLTTQDVIYLRERGVSDEVIGVMQSRRSVVVPAGGVFVQGPPVVYVDSPPPPPVGGVVVVGGGYRGWR
jgi:osmotically inducible lipoprotein OsmB